MLTPPKVLGGRSHVSLPSTTAMNTQGGGTSGGDGQVPSAHGVDGFMSVLHLCTRPVVPINYVQLFYVGHTSNQLHYRITNAEIKAPTI